VRVTPQQEERMHDRLLTIVVTGAAGLMLGAGMGVASAQTGGTFPRSLVEASAESNAAPTGGATMDETHDSMREQMSKAMRETCDEMHAGMAARAGSNALGSMMGSDDTDHAARHG